MKIKVFEPGAFCAALALLVMLSLPAYAKSGGSTASHTRVGKTSTSATSQTGQVQPQRLQQKMNLKSKVTETQNNIQKRTWSTGDKMIQNMK